jgi:hypothetical protein
MILFNHLDGDEAGGCHDGDKHRHEQSPPSKEGKQVAQEVNDVQIHSCIILKSRRVSISIPLARHHHVTVPFLKSRNSFADLQRVIVFGTFG